MAARLRQAHRSCSPQSNAENSGAKNQSCDRNFHHTFFSCPLTASTPNTSAAIENTPESAIVQRIKFVVIAYCPN
jgi:hypothetical protein